MLMVIFGAGASFDSYPSLLPRIDNKDRRRPPLAKELFSDREQFSRIAKQFPDCQPILPFLRETASSNTSVEQVLEELQTGADQNARRYVQLAAIRHYLRSIIKTCESEWSEVHKGVTNYLTLFDEIEAWRRNESVCLVTFNYDTMIEDALRTVKVRIGTIQDYIASPSYQLIKLHGSVNWARRLHLPMNLNSMTAQGVTDALIQRAWEVNQRLLPEYVIATNELVGKSNDGPLIPAMAIPIVTKKLYECPKAHEDLLCQRIPQITKLLVIGWRGNEQHFLRLLRENMKRPVHVLVVSGNSADRQETSSHLTSTGMAVIGGIKKFDQGFSKFIMARQVRQFLEG